MKFSKQNIGRIVFCAIFLVSCAFFSLGMLIPGASDAAEGATFPTLIKDGRVTQGFGNDLEEWFAKRFAWRGYVVDGFAAIKEKVFKTGNDQVIVGDAGFLFFSETLDCYTGAAPMTDEELNAAADTLAAMHKYVTERGGSFLFVCAPNKNTVYGEYMPKRYAANEAESDMDRLQAMLQSRGVPYCDLRPVLAAGKSEQLLYHKRDSHWNGMGAFLAYEEVMKTLGHISLDPSTLAAVEDHRFAGDLDGLLYPGITRYDENRSYNYDGQYIYTSAYSTPMDLQITTRGGGEGKLLMFRDSFANAWISPFAASFASARFERAMPYRLDMMDRDGADTVIVEIAERNLRDLAGAWQAE